MAFGHSRTPKHLVIHENYDSCYPIFSKPRRRNRRLSLTLIACLAAFLGLLSVEKTRASDNKHTAGELRFRVPEGPTQTNHADAVHLETKVEASINGLVAKVVYQQSFQNQSEDWQEAVYTFPLPETAGVNYMEMRIGDRTIIGEIKEKQHAKRIYKQALREGKRAALTEQQRPNLFTQKIANIAPNDLIQITLHYQQSVNFDSGRFEWRLPTTLTPRYIPGTPIIPEAPTLSENRSNIGTASEAASTVETNSFGWALPTTEVRDADKITPPMKAPVFGYGKPNPIDISISLNAGLALADINALYHDVTISKSKKHHEIKLRNGQDEMDRDFVLQWRPTKSSTPQAAVFSEEVEGDFYSLLMLIPPSDEPNGKLARDIIFVIDTSGSMQGTSIKQAKQSLALALNQLDHTDRFNIIEFNSAPTPLFNTLQAATPQSIQTGLAWVNKLNANGGTEMYSALETAFDKMLNSERLQQVVFITDGAVGNEQALFSLIDKRLNSTRLFTVGIGSAPNSYFMRKAAEFGRGTHQHIGDTRDVSQTMNALFEKLNSAVSTQIQVDWRQDAEQYPQRIGELYKNKAMLVTAKTKTQPTSVDVTGELKNKKWQQNITNYSKKKSKRCNGENCGISVLWARNKISHLEDEHTTGSIDKISLREKVLALALNHKLVSRFTSFVAVEKKIARSPESNLKHSPIKNQLAFGQTPQSAQKALTLPQTATTAEIAWWLGLFSFFIALIIHRMKGDEQ